jgi:hypothetical protein
MRGEPSPQPEEGQVQDDPLEYLQAENVGFEIGEDGAGTESDGTSPDQVIIHKIQGWMQSANEGRFLCVLFYH